MSQPTACCRALPPATTTADGAVSCVRCDLLVGLDGYSVIDVVRDDETGRLRVTVESGSALLGCPGCGVIACSRGRREVRLIDIPAFAAPVDLVWRKRLGRCAEPLCEVGPDSAQISAPAQLMRASASLRSSGSGCSAGTTCPPMRTSTVR